VPWTQSLIECKAETKQLHPTRLTQGTIAHSYFWEERPGFVHCPFHLTPHIFDGIRFYDSKASTKLRVNGCIVTARSVFSSNCDENCTSRDCMSGTYEIAGRWIFVRRSVRQIHNNYLLFTIQGVPGGMDKTSGECSLC